MLAVQVVMAKTGMRSCGVLQQQQRPAHPAAMNIRFLISRGTDRVKRAPLFLPCHELRGALRLVCVVLEKVHYAVAAGQILRVVEHRGALPRPGKRQRQNLSHPGGGAIGH